MDWRREVVAQPCANHNVRTVNPHLNFVNARLRWSLQLITQNILRMQLIADRIQRVLNIAVLEGVIVSPSRRLDSNCHRVIFFSCVAR